MIDIKHSYDSDHPFPYDTCDLCRNPIPPSTPRVLIGTGNSLLLPFHPSCWDQLLFKFQNPDIPHNP